MELIEILESIIKSKYGWSVAEQFETTFDDNSEFENQNTSALEIILNELQDIPDSVFSEQSNIEIKEYIEDLISFLND